MVPSIGRADDGVVELHLRVVERAFGLLDLGAQRVDFFLARTEPHKLVRAIERSDFGDRGIVARLRIVERLLSHDLVANQAVGSIRAKRAR